MDYDKPICCKTCKSVKMPVFIVLYFLSGIWNNVFADGGPNLFPKGARAEGMGKSSLINVDVWAVYNNQAALAYLDKPVVGVNYENRFVMNPAGISAGVFALPAMSGTFGFNIAHAAVEDAYSETRIGAGYGKKLAKNIALGIQFNYHLLSFSSGYSDFYAFTGEIGLIAQPLKNIYIGAHVFNPSFSRLNSAYEAPVPVIFKLGAGYKTEKLLVVSEIEKERLDDFVPHFGLEYLIFRNMYFRSGVSLNPVQISFGAGWISKKLSLDFAFSHHQILGFTPQIGFLYKFTK
ncbi:MAG: hypothetical protein LBG92_03765 [Prevotellaceae bacterium]|jgi:hypothetical protein|nr:hypothetical protein [Prevotellaceae bacterium]